jgi:hypothetical protein
MKTAMQELLQILESKILPCDDDNSYVYGMNVAHANLIYNIKNGFLEKEKEQIIDARLDGFVISGEGWNGEYPFEGKTYEEISLKINNEEYYKITYDQN